MRFKMKEYRVVKRFALFPIKFGHETRWLETVYIRQEIYDSFFGSYYYDKCFTTKEEYEKYKTRS